MTTDVDIPPIADPAKLDWSNLNFNIVRTKGHVECIWREGQGWLGVDNKTQQVIDAEMAVRVVTEPLVTMHIAATVLHYGQSVFEGMKAFKMKDGKVRIFRPELNAVRLQQSCEATSMAFPSESLFLTAIQKVVELNKEYVPPYGSNGSLYIRPFVIGTGAQLGLSPSPEIKFLIMVNPVGDYYKGGMGAPSKALIKYGFDRAAPRGTGHVKVGGNYAPALGPTLESKKLGFPILLFLDAKTHSFVEEFATSNFAALTPIDPATGKRTYVTPKSRSILPSVTNRSLMELAEKHFGWKTERRKVAYKELLNETFEEVAACGTAVIITPVSQVSRQVLKLEVKQKILKDLAQNAKTGEKRSFEELESDVTVEDDVDFHPEDADFKPEDFSLETCTFSENMSGFKELYTAYRALQYGDLDGWESYNWMWPAEGI